ncbi:IS630 family transposase [Sedimentitalea sp. HM32M-2]|uniref:IS630 family transposase n=1 Tax=Sedimentitalea sp. HM32M-2 TaxID=3351566 RepID=UPI003643F61E
MRERAHDICGMGPPWSGALTVGQILGLLEPAYLAERAAQQGGLTGLVIWSCNSYHFLDRGSGGVAMVGRVADAVVPSDQERRFLEGQVRRHQAPRSLSDRCRMILLCAEGLPGKEVAAQLGVHAHTVGTWRRRFVRDRIEGLTDEYRPGRPRTVSDEPVAEVIERTLNSSPGDATHWSIRSMAAATGLSHTTIRRIWTAFGLRPHRSETFKLSTDPLFGDKVQDIVGLYLSPPNRAIVLCGRKIPNPGPRPRATRPSLGARRGRAAQRFRQKVRPEKTANPMRRNLDSGD